MDKLKPLLVHKFWIILFIALLLPVIGWSMATGGLAKEIDERTSKINAAFTAAQIKPNPPNQTWSTALKEINKNKSSYIGQSNKMLWEKQKELFVWPSRISVLMKDTPYRGDISFVPRNFYRSDYKVELLRVHKLAKPFNLRDGSGLIDFPRNVIPHVSFENWVTSPPTSEEMWDAQEDVWLLTSIVKAIANVNEGVDPKNIGESAIRQISALQLRGGTSGEGGQNDLGAGMDPDMAGMAGEGMPGGPGAFGGGGGMLAGRDAMGGTKTIEIDLDLTEIFGNDIDTSAAPGGDEDGGIGIDPGALPGPGMLGGIGGEQKLIRYFDDKEELPYKTRAFYIKVVMEPTKLPHLLSELTKMPWPVEIKRVQVADLFDDNLNPLATSGSGGGMGGRGPMMGRNNGVDDFGLDDEGIDGRAGQPGFVSPEEGGLIGGDQGRGNQKLLDAALKDPGLAVVSIAGLMTLYKPYPPQDENAEQTEGNDGNPGQQPTTDSATQPTDSTTAAPEPANPESAATLPNDASTNPNNSQNAPVKNPENNPAVPSEVKPDQPTGTQPTDPKPDESQSPKSDPPKTDSAVKQ